jgi:hypothetical protein
MSESIVARNAWVACIASVQFCLAAPLSAAASLPTFTPVAVEADTTTLPASEQAALVPLLRAARLMDSLYIRQVWPGTRDLMAARGSAGTAAGVAELDALNFFKGPWAGGVAFIDGVPSEQPVGDYYPSGTTRHDMDAWLGTLSETDRRYALGNFTVIEHGRNRPFEAVPYSRHYRDSLTEAARALREAAISTHETTLRKYLNLRAQALLDDDYYSSDVAFVGLKGALDVKLGPYEVDDDVWFGVKSAYEASIALVNAPATQRVARIAARLQELEDRLPLARDLRARKLGAIASIVVLDVIYHGGQAAAGGAEAGYGLPNDLRVLNTVGARTGTYSNILEARYDNIFRPIAAATLTDADRLNLKFGNIRDEIMFVRIFDALGPQFVTGTRQPISAALGENGAVAAQIRSMLLALWGHRYLIEHGFLDRGESDSLYSAFVVVALAGIRAGLDSTPRQGASYVLNHLMAAGALTVASDGHLNINRSAADSDIVRAAAEFITPMAKGDAATVQSLLRQYVVITPMVRSVLARLGPLPLLRPRYVTADRLCPPG